MVEKPKKKPAKGKTAVKSTLKKVQVVITKVIPVVNDSIAVVRTLLSFFKSVK